MAPSSYLFVPGDAPGKISKASGSAAGALILDLEDAVAPTAKESARRLVAAAVRDGTDRPQTWVRVNQPPLLADDIAAVAHAAIAGVVVPKAEPQLLAEADYLLGEAERRHRLAAGSLGIIALVESARGLLTAAEIAAHPRVVRLAIGEVDLVSVLGLQPGPDGAELLPLRLGLVIASVNAGLPAPIGPVEIRFSDDEALRDGTAALLRLGYRARFAVHPRQIPIINEVFRPSAQEVLQARQVIEAFEAGQRSGSGVAVAQGQRFVDVASLGSAREVLSRHVDQA